MLAVVWSALAGVVFGFALAAPPGPMNAIIAEESVLRGWSAGARAGLGAMLADMTFFFLALFGVVGFVRKFPTIQAVMVGVGGILMLYFAYGAAKGATGTDETFSPEAVDAGDFSATDNVASAETTRTDGSGHTGFRKAFVLALTNPYQILFWLTMGVGLLKDGQADLLAGVPYVGNSLAGTLVVHTGSPALVVGFFGGIVLWITGFPAALVTAERRVDSFAPAVAGVSAVVLGGFGVVFLWNAATTLL